MHLSRVILKMRKLVLYPPNLSLSVSYPPMKLPCLLTFFDKSQTGYWKCACISLLMIRYVYFHFQLIWRHTSHVSSGTWQSIPSNSHSRIYQKSSARWVCIKSNVAERCFHDKAEKSKSFGCPPPLFRRQGRSVRMVTEITKLMQNKTNWYYIVKWNSFICL